MDTVSDSPVVLLTPEQAAEALGIGRWKLYDLLRQSIGSVCEGAVGGAIYVVRFVGEYEQV